MSTNYQVIARRYRPQTFADVLGQDAIVTTLKNAIRFNRTANAYLFSGSRGTGKTTFARLLAKALNCSAVGEEIEPCNQCASCREITSGYSLDVIEIDGASNRGIDDIRQINETVAYTSASGKYKIYIIDEVHMLTKEAFNALLKTLEEPPPNVKFIFATTESHKVLPTIVSRCQRFNLNRIPNHLITLKLEKICQDNQVNVEAEALQIIAQRAEGGLRDAESLLDQMLAFHGNTLSTQDVADLLGVLSRDALFALDRAGKERRLEAAFEITHELFSQGRDLNYFVEALLDHFRTLLLFKVCGPHTPLLQLSATDKQRYAESLQFYQTEQCLWIVDTLTTAQTRMRTLPSPRIALETLLLEILLSHQRVTLPQLIRRLHELEAKLVQVSDSQLHGSQVRESQLHGSEALESQVHGSQAHGPQLSESRAVEPRAHESQTSESRAHEPHRHELQATATSHNTIELQVTSNEPQAIREPAAQAAPTAPTVPATAKEPTLTGHTLQLDALADMLAMPKEPTKTATSGAAPTAELAHKPAPAAAVQMAFLQPTASKSALPRPMYAYDTLLNFAAVQLEGSIQRKFNK